MPLPMRKGPGGVRGVWGGGPPGRPPPPPGDAGARGKKSRLDFRRATPRPPADPANESPKPGDKAFATSVYRILARPADALAAAERRARAAGYDSVVLGGPPPGDRRDVAADAPRPAQERAAAGPRTPPAPGHAAPRR